MKLKDHARIVNSLVEEGCGECEIDLLNLEFYSQTGDHSSKQAEVYSSVQHEGQPTDTSAVFGDVMKGLCWKEKERGQLSDPEYRKRFVEFLKENFEAKE